MPTATYTPIATYTVPSNVSGYDFTSVPSGYAEIVVRCKIKTVTTNDNILLRFNNSSTGYWHVRATGNPPIANGDSGSSTYVLGPNVSNTHYGYVEYNIFNYADTSKNTTLLYEGDGPTVRVDYGCATWLSTTTINTIRVFSNSNIAAGSVITLFGITRS